MQKIITGLLIFIYSSVFSAQLEFSSKVDNSIQEIEKLNWVMTAHTKGLVIKLDQESNMLAQARITLARFTIQSGNIFSTYHNGIFLSNGSYLSRGQASLEKPVFQVKVKTQLSQNLSFENMAISKSSYLDLFGKSNYFNQLMLTLNRNTYFNLFYLRTKYEIKNNYGFGLYWKKINKQSKFYQRLEIENRSLVNYCINYSLINATFKVWLNSFYVRSLAGFESGIYEVFDIYNRGKIKFLNSTLEYKVRRNRKTLEQEQRFLSSSPKNSEYIMEIFSNLDQDHRLRQYVNLNTYWINLKAFATISQKLSLLDIGFMIGNLEQSFIKFSFELYYRFGEMFIGDRKSWLSNLEIDLLLNSNNKNDVFNNLFLEFSKSQVGIKGYIDFDRFYAIFNLGVDEVKNVNVKIQIAVKIIF